MLNNLFILATAKGIWKAFLGGIFGLACDIYVTMARVYSLITDLATTKLDMSDTIYSFVNTIYVLCAVFMLFRITVSFLNMLIDPDRINDKSSGSGAIIKRVFISALLILILYPGSYFYNFLDRVEKAILDENGLISQFVDALTYDSVVIPSENTSNNGVYDCYFFSQIYSSFEQIEAIDLGYGYHLRISENPNSLNSPKLMEKSNKYYYEFVNDTISYNGVTYTFVSHTGVLRLGEYYRRDNNDLKGCPTYVTANSYKLDEREDLKFTLRNTSITFEAKFNVYGTKEKFMHALGKYYSEHSDIVSNSQFFNAYDSNLEQLAKKSVEFYSEYNETGLTDGQLAFGAGIFRSFMTSQDSNVNDVTEKLLMNSKANEEIFNAYDDGEIRIDLFMSLIAGIVITVYLIYICVDVVIRFLKLMFLMIVAPIPIISYIDPKDKVFNEWLKMFFTTYADLFIKLIGIGLALKLLDIVLTLEFVGWSKLFYIFGLLVFMKLIPSMVNKIFGIDMSTSSFKEIGSMVKKGAGIAVGSVVAAGVGAISGGVAGGAVQGGAGKKFLSGLGGALLGATRGGLRGVGSGYSGNVLGGARSIASTNARVASANRSGSTFWGRTASTMAHAVGGRDAYERAQAEYEGNNAFVESAKSTEDMALDIARKQAGSGNAHAVFKNLDSATSAYDSYKSGTYTGTLTQAQLQNQLKQAEKAAREKVINDTYNGNLTGYVNYATDIEREKLMNSIQATETLGSQIGSTMLKQELDSSGNATGKMIWNKGSRDLAESASIQAKGEMNRHKPDHDVSSQNQ